MQDLQGAKKSSVHSTRLSEMPHPHLKRNARQSALIMCLDGFEDRRQGFHPQQREATHPSSLDPPSGPNPSGPRYSRIFGKRQSGAYSMSIPATPSTMTSHTPGGCAYRESVPRCRRYRGRRRWTTKRSPSSAMTPWQRSTS